MMLAYTGTDFKVTVQLKMNICLFTYKSLFSDNVHFQVVDHWM